MSFQLANANVVVVAQQFNPSIVNQLWLFENGLVGREEFQAGCIFSDMMANVATPHFLLFVSPEQLQFTPRVSAEAQQDLVTGVVGRLVETLPHTPYSAVGLNFTWHLRVKEGELSSRSRELFFDDRRPLCRAFNEQDAGFGAYFSKNALGCRLKLDVKPAANQIDDERVEVIQFAFNFHREVPRDGTAVKSILELLNKWNEARELAFAIANTALEN